MTSAKPQAAKPDAITEPQKRAIETTAARLFSRASSEADLRRMTGKPLGELSKAEASALLDRLIATERNAARRPTGRGRYASRR